MESFFTARDCILVPQLSSRNIRPIYAPFGAPDVRNAKEILRNRVYPSTEMNYDVE